MNKKMIVILLSVIGVLIYSNAFFSPFVYDDEFWVISPYLNPLWHAIQNWTGNRYLTLVSFALNNALFGTGTFSYHATNILIHILNALLVYFLWYLTFKTPAIQLSNEVQDKSIPFKIAFFSSLIFLVHPLQTQAVTYITQRFVSLATLFYLSSLVCYIKFRCDFSPLSEKIKPTNGYLKNFASTNKYYICSLIFAVFAMKSKEISFTLPLILCLYEFTFFTGSVQERLKRLTPFLLTLLIIPCSLLYVQYSSTGSSMDIGQSVMKQQFNEATTLSRYQYLMTQFKVVSTYIRMLLLPVNQHVDYNFPVSKSFLETKTFLSFLFLFFTFFTAAFFALQPGKKPREMIIGTFGILWFFITLSVESTLVPIKHVLVEHRVYLPSVGLIAAIVSLLWMVSLKIQKKWPQIKLVSLIFLSTASLALAVGTYKRNHVWKDAITLYEDEVRKNPNNYALLIRLSTNYAKNGRWVETMTRLNEAMELTLGPTQPKDKRAKMLVARNKMADQFNNQGVFLAKRIQFLDEAIQHIQIALRLNPELIAAYSNLSKSYMLKFDKRYTKRDGTAKTNKDKIAWANKARESLLKSIEIDPNNSGAYVDLGIFYRKMGLEKDSIESYKKAISIQPNNPVAYYNLGMLYISQNKYSMSLEEFEKSLALDPNNPLILKRIEMVKQRIRNTQ